MGNPIPCRIKISIESVDGQAIPRWLVVNILALTQAESVTVQMPQVEHPMPLKSLHEVYPEARASQEAITRVRGSER